jgi:hypothetical protein
VDRWWFWHWKTGRVSGYLKGIERWDLRRTGKGGRRTGPVDGGCHGIVRPRDREGCQIRRIRESCHPLRGMVIIAIERVGGVIAIIACCEGSEREKGDGDEAEELHLEGHASDGDESP